MITLQEMFNEAVLLIDATCQSKAFDQSGLMELGFSKRDLTEPNSVYRHDMYTFSSKDGGKVEVAHWHSSTQSFKRLQPYMSRFEVTLSHGGRVVVKHANGFSD